MDVTLNFSLGSFDLGKKKNKALEKDSVYDLLILGGGPAGLNAALYAKRKGISVGLIAEHLGGQILDTSSVDNYLGANGQTGEGLARTFIEHVQSLEVPMLEGRRAKRYETADALHILTMDDGSVYKARSVLLATGSNPRKLGVVGEDKFYGNGVSYCAICDGPLYKNRKVIVAGGGNSAVEAAMDLAKLASEVVIVHRSQFRADQILLSEMKKYENIQFHLDRRIDAILGEERFTGVKAVDSSGESYEYLADGIFIEIGYVPNLNVFEEKLMTNALGEVIVDENSMTNLAGVFAAGDLTQGAYKQIVIAAADGAKAALNIVKYLNHKSN